MTTHTFIDSDLLSRLASQQGITRLTCDSPSFPCHLIVKNMKATLSSKGQITIPLAVRNRLHLKAGDQLEFDENATVLTAKRVINVEQWEKGFAEWGEEVSKSLEGHPWQKMSSAELMDEMRGPVEENIPIS